MAVNDHAPLAPSSAHLWAPDNGCRASVAMQAAYPGTDDSPEAREGQAAHHYLAETLHGRDVAVGALAPNGHPINAEMIEAATALLVDIRDTQAAAAHRTVRIEEKVYAPSVHASNFGTPDAYLLDRPNRTLHVWDYKYGHRFVDAVRNWQLLDYAIGIFDSEGFSPDLPADNPDSWLGWQITLTIAQPRNYHPVGPLREWFISAETLRDTYLPRLRLSAFESMAPDAAYMTGAHCRDCSGRHACPALQRAGAIAMDVSLQAEPVEMPPHAVGLELRQIDDALARLEARQTGLQEHALGLIRGGTLVPFYSAQHASGREAWTTPAAEVFAAGDIFGVDLREPLEPVTPGQARKAGIPDEVVKGYATKPMGALKLVRVDDDAAALTFGADAT